MKTKEQIIEVLKELKEFNPYPESVFIPVPDEKMEFAARTLKDLNLSPDAIFGHWGRQVWNNCVEKAEEILSELTGKESEVKTAEEILMGILESFDMYLRKAYGEIRFNYDDAAGFVKKL